MARRRAGMGFVALVLALVVVAAGLPGPLGAQGKSTLDTVKERGTLRIGAAQAEPWFFKDPGTQQWSGFGISLGQALAQSLGVKLEIVEVTWVLLLATPVHASMVIGSGAANYSDIIFWAGFEDAGGDNLETSNCNSGTDTSWTPVSGAVINSTTPIAGTYDLSCPTESDQYQLTVTSGDYFNSAKGAIVYAVKPVTQLSDNYYLRLNNAASTNRLMFTMRSTDEVRVTWYTMQSPKPRPPLQTGIC